MIDKRYGVIFRQIREQKQLSLSYFEKYGVLKSNLARFERGETMMGFERVVSMLQVMNITLSDYELFFNYYLPDYQEHFLVELEKAAFSLDDMKCKKLFDEIDHSENRLLALTAKAKFDKLDQYESEEILEYLYRVKYWGYFELSLNYDVAEYISIVEIKDLINIFEKKTSYFSDVTKYRRKIHQIVYKIILKLCLNGDEKFANELLKSTKRPERERIDFYISTLRKLTKGCVSYCFKSEQDGLLEINQSLNLLEELGNAQLKQYYLEQVKPILMSKNINFINHKFGVLKDTNRDGGNK